MLLGILSLSKKNDNIVIYDFGSMCGAQFSRAWGTSNLAGPRKACRWVHRWSLFLANTHLKSEMRGLGRMTRVESETSFCRISVS
jgi:hypothetical protein